MTEIELHKIFAQLSDHESRLNHLESGLRPATKSSDGVTDKQKTLREIVKGKKFKNGSEKIAAIVGYHEKMIGKLINKVDIGKNWVNAKVDGTYKTNLLDDANGIYVRIHTNGECDLTQTGENFFDNFLTNESTSTTSE